jgi:ribosomal protein L23
MALFGKNKKAEEKQEAAPAAPAIAMPSMGRDLSHVLKHARITEKATMHADAGVYTFDINAGSTKRDVMQAVRLLYKVTPRKVAIVSIPTKTRRNVRTGKPGRTGGGKKAYVYLKKGETMTIS